MKAITIMVRDFYDNPDEVRQYALNSKWYYPYWDQDSVDNRDGLKKHWE